VQALEDWHAAYTELGPRHETTLAALLTLAEARKNAGDVVAAKKALSRSARTLGNDAYETLRWRCYLAWWFWYGHEFETAGRRTRRLVDDCVRLLGEDHELTDASRKLLSFIDSQSRGGLSLFWDGSTLV
jgi:hypothetical protein